MSHQSLSELFRGKIIAILGFAREGQSTYKAIRKFLPDFPLIVCDQNPQAAKNFSEYTQLDVHTRWFLGEHYLEGVAGADLIIKSPGIPFKVFQGKEQQRQVYSQTEIFLKLYGKQVVGITGTKGKSTTSSLLYHIFKTAGRQTVLAGNIGTPPFDLIDQIEQDTIVVYEMSSHQLEHIRVSPQTAIFLNVFQEHLDHYPSYRHYQLAKLNIARWQTPDAVVIYNPLNEVVNGLFREFDIVSQKWVIGNVGNCHNQAYFDNDSLKIVTRGKEAAPPNFCRHRKLQGNHNLLNIAAAALAAYLHKVSFADISQGVATFGGLPHRLEFIGEYRGIKFYNDSISTIPESTIEALKTFDHTNTLMLGGFDRGVDYKPLMKFLAGWTVLNLVFIGAAGKRMFEEGRKISGIRKKNCYLSDDFEPAFWHAVQNMPDGGVCLLSPAAASYDSFRNFEHRGDFFRELVNRFGLEKRNFLLSK